MNEVNPASKAVAAEDLSAMYEQETTEKDLPVGGEELQKSTTVFPSQPCDMPALYTEVAEKAEHLPAGKAVRVWGDDTLAAPSSLVTDFGIELKKVISNLAETFYSLKGFGLAAPQIGVSQRIIMVDMVAPLNKTARRPYILINPTITKKSKETVGSKEFCFSVPGYGAYVKRADKIDLTYQNEKGETFTMENVEGFLARVLQHEIDHLDGKLFVDYLPQFKQSEARRKMRLMIRREA